VHYALILVKFKSSCKSNTLPNELAREWPGSWPAHTIHNVEGKAMSVKLFLFEKNRTTLKEALERLGDDSLELENLIEQYAPENFDPGVGREFNNPWSLDSFDGGDTSDLASEEDLGFGVPLVLPDRAAARALLATLSGVTSSEGGRIICSELTPMAAELAPQGQHWCPGGGAGYAFGTRAAARRLIGAESLDAQGMRGKGVNILVVDQGLNQDYLAQLGGVFGGGVSWEADGKLKLPGKEKGAYLPVQRRHGAMMLRSIIDLAPEALIFDFPLIPRRITGSDFFGLNAVFAFWTIRLLTKLLEGPWVILNAWGLVDRFAETVRGDYSNNRGHWLNVLVASIGKEQDVIFAAGNNGQFCGDPRATGYDRGPGRSIFGANGLPEVYSAGAIRTDGNWVGAASQGPGPKGFADSLVTKPDLAIPSWFNEDQDPSLRNGGTSSAAAMLAGAVAALRSETNIAGRPPAELRDVLRNSARPTNGPGWSKRTGAGILNVRHAIPMLMG
jgi:hypothetical protein